MNDIYGLPNDAKLIRSTTTNFGGVETELYYSKFRMIYILIRYDIGDEPGMVRSHKITFDASLGEEFAANLERLVSKNQI